LTRLAILIGVVSLISGVVMWLGQLANGWIMWWPGVGLLLSLGLIGAAFLKGFRQTVEARVAMNDAMNRCYVGEPSEEESR
jgi:hypothetical protein